MSSLPPSTAALQRILSGDRQAIMTEVSQINATGTAVLDDLLYSDGAVLSSPIRIPSPVRGHSVEALLKHSFFNPTDIGATLAFMDQAGLELLAEEDIEVSDNRRRSLRRRNLRRRKTLTSEVSVILSV